MTEATEFRAALGKYAGLIQGVMGNPPVFSPSTESDAAVQVERGIVFPSLLLNRAADVSVVGRTIELSTSPRLSTIVVTDRAGHHRPVYRPLLIYCWLQAFRLVYETLPREEFGRWEEGLRAWCDLLEAELGAVSWPDGGMPASRGAAAVESAWTALALHVAGKVFIRDAWIDLASDTFGGLIRGQQPTGAFLRGNASDNPETQWYHELALLHAAASYAVQAEDRTLAAAVARNTTFHQNQTQPDHASSQPFGLFAFIWNESTRSLADQSMHAVSVQSPHGADGVSLMLLGDALYCLRLFGV